jgi:hypothetical protein
MTSLDIARAAATLRSNYKPKRVDVYSDFIEVENDVALGNELFLTEFVVDANGIKVTSVKAARTDLSSPNDGLDFRDVTASYQTYPELVDYLKKLKEDVWFPRSENQPSASKS